MRNFILLLAVLLIAGCAAPALEKSEAEIQSAGVSSTEDLSRLSIKDLSLLSGYALTEKNEPWDIIKAEVDYAFSQTFVKVGVGLPKDAPSVIVLDARTYKTLQTAEEKYSKPHEEETELGTRTEKNKEDVVISGKNAKLSLIRPDTGSYAVEILFIDRQTVIMVLVADFTAYKDALATEIAEAVAQKI